MAADKTSTDSAGIQSAADDSNPPASMLRLVPIDAVTGLENRVRPLSPKHLLELAASIASHGLVSPISVDSSNVLLAGAHRLAAFRLLRHADPTERQRTLLELLGKGDVDLEKPPAEVKQYLNAAASLDQSSFAAHHPGDAIPARVHAFDSKNSEKRALAIEVAENEKRRNFSSQEVDQIIKRLESAGYTTKHGRLKAGEKALVPELTTILKVSRRSVFRLLDEYAAKSGAKKEKSTRGRKKDARWLYACKHFLGSSLLIQEADKISNETHPKEWPKLVEAIKKLTMMVCEIDGLAERQGNQNSDSKSKATKSRKRRQTRKA